MGFSPIRWLRAVVKFMLVIIWLLVVLVPVIALHLLKMRVLKMRLIQGFYVGLCFIIGLRVTLHGVLDTHRPLLMVSNHSSYLDILVMGRLFPISFTPKREIRSWPVIGFLCVLADCVFVERRRGNMQQAQAEMQRRLEQGKVLCIFPEGTTNNGREVQPFKSGFFSLSEQNHLPVQPVTVAYTTLNGAPIADSNTDHIAWIGEATLLDHVFRFLGYRNVEVVVTAHPAYTPDEYEDRKSLAAACHVVVKHQLRRTLEKAVTETA